MSPWREKLDDAMEMMIIYSLLIAVSIIVLAGAVKFALWLFA